MSKIAIAGLQLEAVNGNNLDSMESEINAVAKRFPWVDMVLLPELNAFGSDQKAAQPMPGPFEARFSEIARRNDIWLIPGSIVEKQAGKLYNTTPVINPDGEVIARYRKQFPWCPYEQEHDCRKRVRGFRGAREWASLAYQSATTCGSPKP